MCLVNGDGGGWVSQNEYSELHSKYSSFEQVLMEAIFLGCTCVAAAAAAAAGCERHQYHRPVL